MATVPRYSSPQVAPSNIPNVRISDAGATPEAFGGNAAVGAFAGVAQQLAQQEQEKFDTAKLMQAQRSMSDLDVSLLNDPEKGAFAKQGEAAIGLDKTILPEWDRQAASIADGLPAHLRAKFQGYVASRRERTQSQLMQHSMGEAEKFYTANENATIKSFADEALRNGNDPEAVDTAIASGWQAIDAQAQRRGLSADVAKQSRADYASGIYRSVLESQIAADPIAADARFQGLKSRMTGVDAQQVEDKLRPLLQANEFEAIGQVAVSGGAPSVNVVPPPRGNPTPEIKAAIEAAAAKYGVPVQYLYALCEQESSFNPRAVNKTTGAAGLFQYIPTTAKDRGIDPFNVREACEAAARDFAERMKAGGPQEAMASHFAGPGGGNRGEKTAAYVAEVTGRAMRWAGESGKAAGSPPATLGEALDAIKADPRYDNPVWRRGAQAAIEHQWSLKERDDADRDRAMLDSLRQRVNAAPIGASLASTLGPDYSTAATKGWLPALGSIANAKAEGRLIQTDPLVYDKYARMLATNAGEFAKPQTIAAIMKDAGRLGTDDLARLRSTWEKMQTPHGAKAQADWASDNDRLESAYRLLGISAVRGKPAEKETERAQFRLLYQQASEAFIQSTGKKPTPEQADTILRTLTQRVAEHPERLAGAVAAERLSAGFDVQGADGPVRMTDADRSVVRAELVKRGIANPTDAQITTAAGAYFSKVTSAD